jgi:hypothetical protein
MSRDPFDMVCTCAYETETHHCVCVKRQHRDYIGPARPCPDCAADKHKLAKKSDSSSLSELRRS